MGELGLSKVVLEVLILGEVVALDGSMLGVLRSLLLATDATTSLEIMVIIAYLKKAQNTVQQLPAAISELVYR
ncbi:hypothetical protein V6N11_045063 [Hibiscus sabdariffa]|uniref:Uncharacterized protein n=1 Tax=Hibiscus sabdariffa TaxID=183260 RepID=A0ABR2A670_9ROSI